MCVCVSVWARKEGKERTMSRKRRRMTNNLEFERVMKKRREEGDCVERMKSDDRVMKEWRREIERK